MALSIMSDVLRYRFDVDSDGTWSGRKTFAYVSPGFPDGVHCDTNGNVYSGVGDGVHVWNPSGKLLGKIFLGATSANFAFAGKGRMVICAETNLYYAEIAAEGAVVASQMPSGYSG
jgi:gluconolactonase